MPTIAAVLEDVTKPNGRRVRYEYTYEDGKERRIGPKTIGLGVNAQTDANNSIPVADSDQRGDEINLALTLFFEGKDMDAEVVAGTFNFLDQTDVRKNCLRRLANMLEESDDFQSMANTSAWVNSLSNSEIRTALNTAAVTWTLGEANTLIKTPVFDLAAEIASLPHGKGDIDEDE